MAGGGWTHIQNWLHLSSHSRTQTDGIRSIWDKLFTWWMAETDKVAELNLTFIQKAPCSIGQSKLHVYDRVSEIGSKLHWQGRLARDITNYLWINSTIKHKMLIRVVIFCQSDRFKNGYHIVFVNCILIKGRWASFLCLRIISISSWFSG